MCGKGVTDRRTAEQNAKIQAMCRDVSQQVVWHGSRISQDGWRAMFAASLWGQKTVPNLDNTGFIILGRPTRRLPVKEASDLIDFIYAFGAEHNVKFKGDK